MTELIQDSYIFFLNYYIYKSLSILYFEVISELSEIETFEVGAGIRELPRLKKKYGAGRWRKRKGIAEIKLDNNSIITAELHWYEASGVGKRKFKIKRNIG